VENSPEFMNSRAGGQDARRHANSRDNYSCGIRPGELVSLCENPFGRHSSRLHGDRLAVKR
jgi:hypothetical protein